MILLLCAGIALACTGCPKAPVKPGNDAVLVNLERTQAMAEDTLDAFFKYEYDNRAFLPPEAVKFAADMRPKAKKLILETDAGIKLYRSSRLFADGKTADQRLNSLQDLAREARLKLIELQSQPRSQTNELPQTLQLRKAA